MPVKIIFSWSLVGVVQASKKSLTHGSVNIVVFQANGRSEFGLYHQHRHLHFMYITATCFTLDT